MSQWPMVPLGTVLSLNIDAVKVDPSIHYNFAGVYSFGRGLFSRDSQSGADTTYKVFHRLHYDDYVISQPKAWEGAIARIGQEFDGRFLSPVFSTFRPKHDQLNSRYLEWYCKQQTVWEKLRFKAKGMGARRETVSPTQFLTLEIPLPPLAEQRRLVERIDALAAKIEEAKGLRVTVNQELHAFLHSHFNELYEAQCAINGATPLAEVCTSITDGTHLTPTFQEKGVKFIFVGNVSSSRLHFTGCKYVSPDYYSSVAQTRRPKRGDVLYSAVGATLGIPAMVDSDEEFCFQRHVAIIKPNRSKLDSRYLWHMLRSGPLNRLAWASITGTAQPTVPLRAIKTFPIPVPSIAEQKRIVANLDELLTKTEEVKRQQVDISNELNAMLPAILDRAFRGEL
jgi:type I restriction enzyme S subunit